MAVEIHPQAHVEKGAELADGVVVGAFAYVGPHVKAGKGTIIQSKAHVEGHTTLGEGNVIFPFAAIGTRPQDLKYKGEPTELIIGDRNLIREQTTLNIGTVQGGGKTSIGNENLIMAGAHVGHDSHIANRCVLTNLVLLAGHVHVEDYVILGGMAALHQFIRVGAHVIVQANSMIARDVPPFCIAAGRGGALYGLNAIGLKRRGFTKEQLSTMKKAYRAAFRTGLKPAEAVEVLKKDFAGSAEAMQLADFLAKKGPRGVLVDASRKRRKAGGSDESEDAG